MVERLYSRRRYLETTGEPRKYVREFKEGYGEEIGQFRKRIAKKEKRGELCHSKINWAQGKRGKDRKT